MRLKVGKIVNTHSLKGEVKVISSTDFEEQRFENPHRHYLDMSPSYYQLKLDLLNRIYRKK